MWISDKKQDYYCMEYIYNKNYVVLSEIYI